MIAHIDGDILDLSIVGKVKLPGLQAVNGVAVAILNRDGHNNVSNGDTADIGDTADRLGRFVRLGANGKT